ncbi:glycosyltransferase [Candidatus Parabeggiatoa sp. HSG14]|uniref:glycosyltransferase n=1 Tax=Candidatus Parabeggiatoa sp. HSG14 TaxID=3055593 RepID=UPI0025A77E14|nr:glycosyltransferase [Thiotrichales bacterium HSG14]
MPHIALITTSYPTTHDGSEAAGSFVADFAVALAAYAQVTIIAPSLNAEVECQQSITLQRFKVPCLPLSLLKPYNPRDWLAIIKTLRAGLITLEQVTKNEKIDHIFALWALPSGYWAKSISDTYNIPYSTWALGSDIWSLGKVPVIKNILKNVLKSSHTNFADGYLLKQSVESISGRDCHFLPSTRTLTISKQKQLSTNPPYRLAFLGRWHPNKGTDILVESLSTLSNTDWQRIQEIRICGGGFLEETIKATCTNLKEQGHPVVLQGYLNKIEAIELFLWADYVLIPSRIESIPVVFSDAMKCHCPIVSMPVGDLPRLVTEYKVGVLAEEVSAQAFAQAVKQILQQSPQDFATGVKRATNDFSLEHIAEKLLAQLFSSNN